MSIKSALISVYNKDGLEPIVKQLCEKEITIYSTGGTQKYLEDLGVTVIPVEDITSYPSILGGRVKTLHPKVFGGILGRRDETRDVAEISEYDIPLIDLVIVDLYPFEKALAEGKPEDETIEMIDIGGISLIRAAAKNYKHVTVIPSMEEYHLLPSILNNNDEITSLEQRRQLALRAFEISSAYDSHIHSWFAGVGNYFFSKVSGAIPLRYGENPHQKATYYGKLDEVFTQIHGKELSYNNLVDIESAFNIIAEFNEPTFAIIKHTNVCGIASRSTLHDAWNDALDGDPISAFGGIIICNGTISAPTAQEINKLFFEILIAPTFEGDAIKILQEKKNRILLLSHPFTLPLEGFRSSFNGVLVQETDLITDTIGGMKQVTMVAPSENEKRDLEFANKVVKHLKSNAIALVKNKQLIGEGIGQTSRVDALKQAIEKANNFGFDLKGAVMSSDAFFPFPDCVEIASNAGIKAIIQPGGSIRDSDSIDACDKYSIAMVFTGTRHFKH